MQCRCGVIKKGGQGVWRLIRYFLFHLNRPRAQIQEMRFRFSRKKTARLARGGKKQASVN